MMDERRATVAARVRKRLARSWESFAPGARCHMTGPRSGVLIAIVALASPISCSGTDTGGSNGQGGDIAVGGNAVGGVASGGAVSDGGVRVQPGGGRSSFGGATTSGGSNGVGGTGGRSASSSVASTGGVHSSSGGSLPIASTVTGGAVGNGGASPAIGGTPSATGGRNFTGGSVSSGGNVNIGGSRASGGAASTGGTKSTGGASTGGLAATGGVASTGGSRATGGTLSNGGTTHAGAWKIMMLGDSITATTCYPQYVWQDLRAAGHTNFTFIGSVINNQSCSGVTGLPAGGLPTEGHSGHLVVTDANNGSILSWLKSAVPDIVVMHFGTNDVWGNPGQTTANNVLDAYAIVLANLKSVNPNAVLFVAQIIPMNPSLNGCSVSKSCNYEMTLDASIPAWAAAHTTAPMPIYVVNLENLYNGGYFSNTTYTADGVHPTPVGSQPMGTTMSAAIIARGYF